MDDIIINSCMGFLLTGMISSVSQMLAREVVDRIVQLQDERDDRHWAN